MKGDKSYLSVSEFYAGKSVFVTGGSGFLGKVLIEKLLYSCPLVEEVYVLLREKKNVSVEQRLKNMIDHPVFSRIKAEKPEVLKKLVLVRGELAAANLAMSPEDLNTLRDKVSIVIHSAANIRFNESLKIAISINLEGTKKVLELCKSLKQIDAFVFVSTAYSNSDRAMIEEMIYPTPASIDEAYKLAEQVTGDEDITPYLNGWPNTYTYTKALAEILVSDTHGDIPTAIVRPSIVTGSVSEPAPGWVDNWFGPTGLMVNIAMGVWRTVCSEYNYNIDLVPVDVVCNTILVAATKTKRSRKILVYNSCTGSTNPVSIGYLQKLFTDAALKDGFNVLPFPHFVLITRRRWMLKVVVTIMYFFAYLADILLQIVGKEPRFKKIFAQLVLVQDALAFVSSKLWLIKSPKALALAKSLSPKDYELFPCNPQDIVWEEYIPVMYTGIKKYLIEKKSEAKHERRL